jgi:hypothetical protein
VAAPRLRVVAHVYNRKRGLKSQVDRHGACPSHGMPHRVSEADETRRCDPSIVPAFDIHLQRRSGVFGDCDGRAIQVEQPHTFFEEMR